MGLFLFGCGVSQFLAAGYAFFTATSALHELSAVALSGFGVVSLALGAIIERMDKKP